MSVTPAPLLFEPCSPMLSARVTELVQYLNAPLVGRLTDEQRSISLSITRRLVRTVALKIDPLMDVDQLWGDWLSTGVPVTSDLAAICFSRCEEHRWRSAQDQADIFDANPSPMMFSQEQDFASSALFADVPSLSDAYLQLQIVDRARVDNFGYPCLLISDLSAQLYRHLLNEIARWRLGQISRDRLSSEVLGEAVRSAWKVRIEGPNITTFSHSYYQQLCHANLLANEANEAIRRQDWLSFLAIAAAAQRCSYSDAVLHVMALRAQELGDNFAPLGLTSESLGILEAALNALPACVASSEMQP